MSASIEEACTLSRRTEWCRLLYTLHISGGTLITKECGPGSAVFVVGCILPSHNASSTR